MNYRTSEQGIWKFPETISYESVPGYITILNDKHLRQELIIDLTNTETLHTSFIGFLLHAKQVIEKNSGTLEIKLSKRSEKIFHMLNIHEYFSNNIRNLDNVIQ